MNFKELCTKRFSVRSYLPAQVPDSAVEYILECARLAPSAVNKQPWVVYVCRDETVRQQLQAAYNRSWFQQAPMYLVVCHKTDASWVRPADQKNHRTYLSGCSRTGLGKLLGMQLRSGRHTYSPKSGSESGTGSHHSFGVQ